jgi:hypothetical protein
MDRPKKQVEQVADDTDPDGLPRADAAFFAALETDALTARCFAFVCRTVRLCPCVVAMFRSQRLAVLNGRALCTPLLHILRRPNLGGARRPVCGVATLNH